MKEGERMCQGTYVHNPGHKRPCGDGEREGGAKEGGGGQKGGNGDICNS